MTRHVTIIVRVESVDKRGRVRTQWQEDVQSANELPPQIAIDHLLGQAHRQLHPPKPILEHHKD